MNNLKRELAPISTAAWKEIDDEASRVLKLKLAGRKLVDFDGPLGPTAAAVNTGRREPLSSAPAPDVEASRRQALSLIDLRSYFELSREETGSGRARRGGPGAAAPDRRRHPHRPRRGHRDLPRLRRGRDQGHRAGVVPSDPADPRRLPGVPAQHRGGDPAPAPGRRGRALRHRDGAALLHRPHPGGGRRRLPGAERGPQAGGRPARLGTRGQGRGGAEPPRGRLRAHDRPRPVDRLPESHRPRGAALPGRDDGLPRPHPGGRGRPGPQGRQGPRKG